jgi:hypothetical protein
MYIYIYIQETMHRTMNPKYIYQVSYKSVSFLVREGVTLKFKISHDIKMPNKKQLYKTGGNVAQF